MRRTLRGLIIVAGLLGHQACGEKEGPVNPDDRAAVAQAMANSSATNTAASTSAPADRADEIASVAPPIDERERRYRQAPKGRVGKETDAGASIDERERRYRQDSKGRVGKKTGAGATLGLLLRVQGTWILQKRDGTTLTLDIRGTSGRLMASFEESGERVTLLQEVQVTPTATALVVAAQTAQQVGTYNRPHSKYKLDRLRFEYTSGTFKVFDLNAGPANALELVEVRSHILRDPVATRFR